MYERALPSRYYENDNHLSWEFEEHPPVTVVSEDDASRDAQRGNPGGDGESNEGDPFSPHKRKALSTPNKHSSHKRAKTSGGGPVTPTPASASKKTVPSTPLSSSSSAADGSSSRPPNTPGGRSTSGSSVCSATDQPKMKYRCKLCGQPKQNHVCPFQQSLQRSIGTMVFPAVNAFTADEPGVLAAPLSEMNNFVSTGAEVSSNENSPSRPSPSRTPVGVGVGVGGAANVTPESLHSTEAALSPHHARRGGRRRGVDSPGSTTLSPRRPYRPSGDSPSRRGGYASAPASTTTTTARRPDLLFVDAVELKPEQYRIVTPTRRDDNRNDGAAGAAANSFVYPPLPLPYAQRKRLSDNLFALSKEVPRLTDECAVVLREARERDQWDQAVAELMTQVVAVIHCPDGDYRLNGLRQYLLTLGIAC